MIKLQVNYTWHFRIWQFYHFSKIPTKSLISLYYLSYSLVVSVIRTLFSFIMSSFKGTAKTLTSGLHLNMNKLYASEKSTTLDPDKGSS